MSSSAPHAGEHTVPLKSPHLLEIRKSVRNTLDKNKEYVLGVSGGVDSLALAAALSVENYKVTAVIIDHQLQEDHLEFTQKAYDNVTSLGLKACVVKVDVPVTKQGMEASAREARYEALSSFGKPVVIAHTMNDQVETVLMSMCTTTGMSSLTGMSTTTKMYNTEIIRPMLHTVSRENTEGACKELGIDWWEDPHNDNTAFRRVAVRKQLIPLMRGIFGYDVVKRLSDTFNEVSDYTDIVQKRIESLYNEISSPYMLHTEKLLDEDDIIIRGVITEFLRAYNVSYHRAGIMDIYNMITNWKGQGGVVFKDHIVQRHSKNVIMIIPK